jgi:hypothetical protein
LFHPLGEEGEMIQVRAKGVGSAENLGFVDFIFQVGANRTHQLSLVVEKGLGLEIQQEKLNFSMDETSQNKELMGPGMWKTNNLSKRKTFMNDSAVTEDLMSPDRETRRSLRRPMDLKESPYILCRYWGETPSSLVGCLIEPDPADEDASLKLFYFDKNSGLMNGFRFYNRKDCGWVSFDWVLVPGGPIPMTTRVQRKVWKPVTRLQETEDVIRTNIKFLAAAPTATPIIVDPLKQADEEARNPIAVATQQGGRQDER